ncbi:MAG TPA: hypothetical protein VEC57_10480 [Candidatus Limnocylindrales bacterium]|nr:hypothetical protein [Candidatus Limnocylindrales bacterium]
MPEGRYPPVAELLPHRGPAILLHRVLRHDERETRCLVRVDDSTLFARADGSVPAWIGLEYMAQTVAAHGGLLDRAAARPPRPGLFLGSRRLAFAVDRFEAGTVLEARARHLRGNAQMMAFDCSLLARDGDSVLVSGILNVYLVDSFEALTSDFRRQERDDAD